MEVSLTIPEDMYKKIVRLSKENVRTVSQEILYRLEQGLRLKKHISEGDESLLKLIFQERSKRSFDA